MVPIKNLMVGIHRNARAGIDKALVELGGKALERDILLLLFKDVLKPFPLLFVGERYPDGILMMQLVFQILNKHLKVFIKTRLRRLAKL